MADLDTLYAHIDEHAADYVEKLREVVAIPSVSSDATLRPKVHEMGLWLQAELERLGAETKLHYPGTHVMDGEELELPPIVLGTYGTDESKKTVLVYGHYDVQPASLSDGWTSDPFTLTELDNGRMVGRGSTDDKGPVLGWLWVVEAHQQLGIDLPVNLKFCFEGMEENGSEGLDEMIVAEADGYFANVDAVCISDNYWLGTSKPCITFGLRGVSAFALTVTGPGWDLHSGVYGGTLHEPMTDLIHLMSTLVKPNGEILIPGIMDNVADLTEEEEALYDVLDFDVSELEAAAGAQTLIHDDKKQTIMHRWRYPSLSLHGIEGAFSGQGVKTVIPAKVMGKFSIRTVPNQTPDEIAEKVKAHLEAEFEKLGSKNTMHVEALHGGKCWVGDLNHPNFKAGTRATEKVYGVTPDFTREGGSIPVTLTFQDALGKSVLLLPMGRADDGAHSINEKLDKSNYLNGIKLLATYLHELAAETDL
ncbi:Cys-Gly metallodipeptidase [Allomyces arbusculus]|nr:Cys-Gly metallodipeptidase [Allomyces arbusculus]